MILENFIYILNNFIELTVSPNDIYEIIWRILSSKDAIFFYIFVIFILIIMIIIIMIYTDVKFQALITSSDYQKYTKLSQKTKKVKKDKMSKKNKSVSNEEESHIDEKENTSRFFMLKEIDAKREVLANITYNDDITLKQMCEDFRNYAAQKLELNYDIEDIRRFIGSLGVTKIIILQGMSGTGKTSLAYAFGEFIDNPTVIVPVQPMWKERTDLIGYYNEFTQKFNETTLLQKMYEAHYNKGMYLTLLDEINIARIEYYFAEFLSLLELPDYQKRILDVVSDKWDNDPELLKDGRITLPYNMWFIGTANNDDSTFAISDKVYDRAMVLNLDNKAKPFIASDSQIQRVTAKKYYELIEEAQSRYEITDRNLRRIKELDTYLIKHFQITFGNRIMNQIKNYVPIIVASGGTELEAIDDILSKKILRKLESKNLAYVKSEAPDLSSFIENLFGEDEMNQCKKYITHIEINI